MFSGLVYIVDFFQDLFSYFSKLIILLNFFLVFNCLSFFNFIFFLLVFGEWL